MNLNITRNTTPAKPCEGRFGDIWFVCDLKFQAWCSKSVPKTNTHCASYIVHERTADHTDKLENFHKVKGNGSARGGSQIVILFNPLRPKSDLNQNSH